MVSGELQYLRDSMSCNHGARGGGTKIWGGLWGSGGQEDLMCSEMLGVGFDLRGRRSEGAECVTHCLAGRAVEALRKDTDAMVMNSAVFTCLLLQDKGERCTWPRVHVK